MTRRERAQVVEMLRLAIQSAPPRDGLTAEDWHNLHEFLDRWRLYTEPPMNDDDRTHATNAAVVLAGILDRLDAQGKLGRAGR
jgi:hypothetical protein